MVLSTVVERWPSQVDLAVCTGFMLGSLSERKLTGHPIPLSRDLDSLLLYKPTTAVEQDMNMMIKWRWYWNGKRNGSSGSYGVKGTAYGSSKFSDGIDVNADINFW